MYSPVGYNTIVIISKHTFRLWHSCIGAYIAINMHIDITEFSLHQDKKHYMVSGVKHLTKAEGRLKHDILGRLKIGSLEVKSLT